MESSALMSELRLDLGRDCPRTKPPRRSAAVKDRRPALASGDAHRASDLDRENGMVGLIGQARPSSLLPLSVYSSVE